MDSFCLHNGLGFCARIASARGVEARLSYGKSLSSGGWQCLAITLPVDLSWSVMAIKSAHWGLFISIFVYLPKSQDRLLFFLCLFSLPSLPNTSASFTSIAYPYSVV